MQSTKFLCIALIAFSAVFVANGQFQGFPQQQPRFQQGFQRPQAQQFEEPQQFEQAEQAEFPAQPQAARPFRQLPPYKAICKFLQNPTFVNQQVQCAMDPEGGACSKGISRHLQGISTFLRDALPAAAGRASCEYCTDDDYEKIQFIAKYMLRHYPRQTRALMDRYRDEINAYGGVKGGIKTSRNVPEKCPEEQ